MPDNKKRIVVVGSLNVDLVTRVERMPAQGETILGRDFQMHPGGKGANQAVAVARLGQLAVMIGRVGSDAFGSQLRMDLQRAGVEIGAIETLPGSSGVAMIVVSEAGENSIIVTPGANALLTPQDLDAQVDLIRSASMVLTQLEIPMATVEHLAGICRREGVPLILDPAPAQNLPPSVLDSVTWFTPNATEAVFYAGYRPGQDGGSASAVAATLIRSGIRGVVLKLGENGVQLASSDGLDAHVEAFQVQAVDTTAAGDAFNGAFATAMVSGKTVVESARFANAAAALSVTRAGAQPSMPTLGEVQRLLAAGPPAKTR